MTIYLSGPMTGKPDLNFPAFHEAKEVLTKLGHEVVSPADLEVRRTIRGYKEKLRDDLRHLLECDAIYMLPEWQTSFGARIEFAVARAIGLTILRKR